MSPMYPVCTVPPSPAGGRGRDPTLSVAKGREGEGAPKLRLILRLLVGEPGVAEAGADGEDAPMLDALHVRHFAQALHHRVVVQDDERVVAGDLGDALADELRQVEAAAFPVAGEVLPAALDRAVLADEAGAADADEGRQLQLLLLGAVDQILEHADQARDRIVALGLVVAMPPQLRLRDTALRQVMLLLAAQLDDAGAEIAAADIDGEDRVMAGEDPGRRQVDRADEAGLVGMVLDRHQVDVDAVGLEQHRGAADGELADAARAEAAADGDALGAAPGLEAQEAPGDAGELLGEFLDGALDQAGRLGIAGLQHLLEPLLADLVGRRVAERVLAEPRQALAPIGEDLGEGALAGAVADEAVRLAQRGVIGVDADGGQHGGAVPNEGLRGRDLFLGHEPFLQPAQPWLTPSDGGRSRAPSPPSAARRGAAVMRSW